MAIDLTGDQSGTETGPLELRLPPRSLLADDVYETLRDNLRAGRIPAGTRLNLDQLARDLHVSNTPVRQALARLEADGLVTKEPYRGFTASALLDSQTTSDVYEFRLILEPALAARAAGIAVEPDADVSELKELCDAEVIERLIAEGEDEQLGVRDYLFHVAVAKLAGNKIATESLTHAMARVPGYTARDRLSAMAEAWHEHQVIGDAVLAGDAQTAAAGMRDHLRGAYKRMRALA